LSAGAALVTGIVRLASHADDRVFTETAAHRIVAAAAVAAAVVLFTCHLLLDAARAQFAADPRRRSAWAALWSGIRVTARRPLRSVAVGALGTATAVGLALFLIGLRLAVAQREPAAMALAWLLAQGAQLAVGWGHAIRIEGLAELARTHDAERARSAAAAPQVVQPATLSALEPPRSGAPR
jgi:hypothetical protein